MTTKYAAIPDSLDEGDVSVPVLNAQGIRTWYRIHQQYAIGNVITENIGPCTTCRKMMDLVEVVTTTDHTSYSHPDYKPYQMTHQMALHQDGSPCHGIGDRWVPKCPACGAYALATVQEAYGDRTTCGECGHSTFYDIGD